jgi:hypothetical protein
MLPGTFGLPNKDAISAPHGLIGFRLRKGDIKELNDLYRAGVEKSTGGDGMQIGATLTILGVLILLFEPVGGSWILCRLH